MNRILLISVAVVVLPVATVQAQDTPLWRHTTTEKISFYQVTPLGDLVVGTKDGITALAPETGEPKWRRDDLKKLPAESFNPVPYTPYCVVRTKDGIALIDLGTGNTIWDSTAVPLEKVRGYLTVPQQRMLLLYGETPESHRTFVAVEIATGQVRWRQDTLLRKSPGLLKVKGTSSFAGHQPPLVDTDSTFILNISKDGPMRIHSGTGELLWRANTNKDPPMLSTGYAPMLQDRGVLFIPYERKMLALNSADGSVLWNRRKNFRSRVTQMELTAHGLVVRGRKPPEEDDPLGAGKDFFVDVLNLETGSSVWEYPFKDLKVNTPFLVGPNAIYVATERKLVALDIRSGTPQEMAEFKFEGDEKPEMLEALGENFLISSGHNFLAFDYTGTVQYDRFYKAPGMSFLEKVGTMAATIAFFELTEIVDKACARDPNCVSSPWVTTDGKVVNPDIARTVPVAGEPLHQLNLNDPVLQSVLKGFDRLLSRQTTSAENHVHVYTGQPVGGREGFSLVKLDIRDGEEAGRVWIDKRRPDYVLDPISGFVFVKEKDNEIVAFKFTGN